MLFTLFVVVAALPIVLLVDRRWTPDPEGRPPKAAPARYWHRDPLPAPSVALLLAVLLFVPAVAVTATELPPTVQGTYASFGNVSAADFALLAWAPGHLPAGARVVVSPGSAAEFLPSYAPALRVLYPMVVGFAYPNATYRDFVEELTNGTTMPNATRDLQILDADFLAVTGTNSVLGDPFDPAPFLGDPADFPLVFHDGDAYVFAVDLPSPFEPSGGLR